MVALSKKSNDRIYPVQPQVAVGAVVFRGNKVLLVHRGNPPAEGLWAIPGGKVRLGESLQEAAEREILEETGITIRAGEPVLTFDMIDRDETNRIRYHYVIIDLVAEYLHGKLSAGDDALSARWVSSREIATLSVSAMTRRLLQDRFGF
jgi:ADP-ribose pyrophosphatase